MNNIGKWIGVSIAVCACLMVRNCYLSSMNVITPRDRSHSLMSVLLHRVEDSSRQLGRPPHNLSEIFGSEGPEETLAQWRCEVLYSLDGQGVISISVIPLDREAARDLSGVASFRGEAYGQDGSILVAEDRWGHYAFLEVLDGLPE